MTNPNEEVVGVRVQMQNELSGPAAAVTESMREVKEETNKSAEALAKYDLAARRAAAADRELALANEAVARSMPNQNDQTSIDKQTLALVKQIKAHKDLKKAKDELAKADRDELGRNHKLIGTWNVIFDVIGKKGPGAIDKFYKKLFSLHSLFKLMKIELIVQLVRLLAIGLTVLGAAGFAAVAGMTPLLGALVAYPGALLAGAQAMGVFKLAVSGVGQAVTDLSAQFPDFNKINQDLMNLSPNAVTAANYLGAFVSGPFRQFKMQVQDNFFGAFNQDLGSLPTLLSRVQGPLGQTATILGHMAGNLLTFLANSSDLSQLLYENNSLISTFGSGLQNFIAFFLHFMVLAQPFLHFMINGFAEGTAHLNAWVHSAQGAASIGKFFASSQHVMQMTWAILKNIFFTLVNIGHGAHVMSADMGNSLLAVTAKWRAFTGSVEGQRKISKFFADMIPPLHAIGHLLADIIRGMTKTATDPSFTKFINMLDQRVLPAIGELFKVTNDPGVINGLVALFTAAVKVFSALEKLHIIGNLAIILNIFAHALGLLVHIFTALPTPVQHALGLFITMSIIWRKLTFGLQGLLVEAAILPKKFGLMGAAARALGIAFDFLAANPVFLIIGAIAALVVILGVLYFKNKAVHDFLNMVWRDIASFFKSYWRDILAVLMPFIGIPLLIIQNWGVISSFFEGLWGDIKAIFKDSANFMIDILNTLIRGINDLIQGLNDANLFLNFLDIPKIPTIHKIGNTSKLPQQAVPGAANTAGDTVISAPGNVIHRWAGGPVGPSIVYNVGEKGPELYKSDKGAMWLGLHGPEYRTFDSPGRIIPNNLLAAMYGKLGSQRPATAKMRSATATEAARRIYEKSGDTVLQVEGDTLQLTFAGREEPWSVIEQKIKRLWEKLERDKRERMIRHAGNTKSGDT